MKLDNQELFNEFWKEHKDQFPDISHDRMKEAVTYPFLHLKNVMRSGNLASMRIKHLGTFTIHLGRAKSQLVRIKKLFSEGKMLDRDYFRYKKTIETFIEKNEAEDNTTELN